MNKLEYLANWSLDSTDFKDTFSGLFEMKKDGFFFKTDKIFDELYIEKIYGIKKETGISRKTEQRKITLLGCEELLSSDSVIRNFKIESIVDGIHLNENILLKGNVKIYMSNLKDWLNSDFLNYFRPSSPSGENLHEAKSYNVSLDLPEDVVLLENENITIKIRYDNYYQSFVLNKKFDDCEPYIEMSISNKNSYRDYIFEISKLRDFLTFATKNKTYIKEISASTENDGFFRQYFYLPNELLETHDFYMLFPFSLFQEKKLHYGKWLSVLDTAQLECDNFFLALEQNIQHSSRSMILKFIYLVQAIEAWERNEMDLLFNKEEIEEMLRVFDLINNQIVKKEKVKNFTRSCKKQTDLAQKINESIEEQKELLNSIHLRLDQEVCGKIRDTRNYLAHLDPKNKKILTDEGIFWAAALLQILMEVKLMKKIGFSDIEIFERFSDATKGNIYRIYFAGSHFPTFDVT